MDIADFLTQDHVVLDLRLRDKALLFAEAARLLGRAVPTLPCSVIEQALMHREQLGSTGLGAGFALPHARVETLQSYMGLCMRLARPIAFDAIDDKPVDLVFVLLIPEEPATPHVTALAAITRKFRDAPVLARLRKAESQAAAYAVLVGS